jgi:antitoxin HicB
VSKADREKLAYYVGLSYPITVVKEDVGYSIAILDLPGCLSQGDTLEEALSNIEDAKAGWLEIAIAQGREIPEPEHDRSYSGKFMTRVPKGLHKALVIRAKRSGVSLNQYVSHLLTRAVQEEDHRELTAEILHAIEELKEPQFDLITPRRKVEWPHTRFREKDDENASNAGLVDNYAYAT